MNVDNLIEDLNHIGGTDTDDVVAMTPHGSYTFDIRKVDVEGERIVLRLVEIERKS